jgi:hypothetical protein
MGDPTMTNQTRRRRPPARSILGERVRFRPLVDQAIAARAAMSGRSFEQEVCLLIRSHLGA